MGARSPPGSAARVDEAMLLTRPPSLDRSGDCQGVWWLEGSAGGASSRRTTVLRLPPPYNREAERRGPSPHGSDRLRVTVSHGGRYP